MKRFSLLTAAALLASTPLFAMDGGGVSISGEANFGVKFKEHANEKDGDPSELQFHHEFDIKFSASGTTDGGIGFGGSVSIDNTESVAVGKKGAKASEAIRSLAVRGTAVEVGSGLVTQAPLDATTPAFEVTGEIGAINKLIVTTDDKGTRITHFEVVDTTTDGANLGKNKYVVEIPTAAVPATVTRYVTWDPSTKKAVVIDVPNSTGTGTSAGTAGDAKWILRNRAGDDADGQELYLIAPDANGPMTAATAASFDPDASNKIDNHGEVYISMDMHKLTIGSDLDAADKIAGGLADPGFDGIGIDDVAEGVWGKSAADVRYDGDFGVASVAISYGDNKGDAEWAAGFNFNIEPVTVGAGFDSNGVMSIGMGFTQGQVSMNALYSTDKDHDEADNEASKPTDAANNKAAVPYEVRKKSDLKNEAVGVDVSYQMSEATSIVLVAAQHKKESADWVYKFRANDGKVDAKDAPNDTEWKKSSTTVDAFGVGFSHDLGGGATLKAGAGSVDSNAVADLGITMKF